MLEESTDRVDAPCPYSGICGVLNPKAIELLQLTPEIIEEVYEETYRHMDVLLEIFYYDIAA